MATRLALIAVGALLVGCSGTRSITPALPESRPVIPLTLDQSRSALELSAHKIYVANSSANSATEYDRSRSGHLAPLRTLAGGVVLLSFPQGLALDARHAGRYVVFLERKHRRETVDLRDGREDELGCARRNRGQIAWSGRL